MQIQIRFIAAAVTLALLMVGFQNCGPTAVFEGGTAARSIDSRSDLESSYPGPKNQTGEALSGGEGYGGKTYVLINAIDACTTGEVHPGEIHIDTNGQAYLMVRDCERLTTPEAISVEYGPGTDFIQYNGQFYRDVSSTEVLDILGMASFSVTYEAESMSEVADDGYQDGVYFKLTDNDDVAEMVSFSEAGDYWFVVPAKGENDFTDEVDAIMELRINNVPQGQVVVADHAGEYWFIVRIDAIGTHRVSLHFTNDRHQTSPQLNKNLFIDRLTIAKPQ